jgi:hypothetical protein
MGFSAEKVMAFKKIEYQDQLVTLTICRWEYERSGKCLYHHFVYKFRQPAGPNFAR